jgi:NUDIX domain
MDPNESIERIKAGIREQKFTTLRAQPQPGVYIFFSFDLVNSTQFKASYPAEWPVVVMRFYELITNELITRISSAIVWKFVGDEVLFFKQVINEEDLLLALPAAHAALLATMEVLHKASPSSRELLAIKGTVWIAEAQPIQPSDAKSIKTTSRNIIVEPGRSPSWMSRDFLGPDIDAGFRISRFALRRRLVVSAELACLLYRKRAICTGIEKQLKIVSFQILKGVWTDRHYPIVWYEGDWTNVNETFLFDEHLTSDIAAAVKRGPAGDSGLETIEKVFGDLGRTEEIDRLATAITRGCATPPKGRLEIDIPKDRYAEIHCVAVCFSSDGKILAAKRPTTKRRYPNALEFGCGQLRLGESFADCLKRAYKDDFGVDLVLPDPPVPITTYEIRDEDEHRVIPGIIFIGHVAEVEAVAHHYSRQKHSEIMWLDPKEFRPEQHQCVPNFEATMKMAIEARQRIKTVRI